jgi:hypothetical protein
VAGPPGGWTSGRLTSRESLTDTVTDRDESDLEGRAKELQGKLVVLRLREGTANFENKEAIRREINRVEAELESRGVPPDDIEADG